MVLSVHAQVYDDATDLVLPQATIKALTIDPVETIVDASEVRATQIFTTAAMDAIHEIGLPTSSNLSVKNVVSSKDGEYEKVYFSDTAYICLDVQGDIFRISNFDDESLIPLSMPTSTEKNQTIDTIVENIRELLELSDDYELVNVEEFDAHTLKLSIVKRYGELLNPYEAVKVTVDSNTGDLLYLRRFSETPNVLTPSLSEADAITSAKNIVDDLDAAISDITLTFTQPNYFWLDYESENRVEYELANFIRLAYLLTLDEGTTLIYVDALTGEIIGGDATLADKAACYGQTDTHYYMGETTTIRATSGFSSLGYTTTRQNSDVASTLKTSLSNFMLIDDAYGLYIRSHGDAEMTILATEKNDVFSIILNCSDVSGNWHFVFLDACYTGTDSTWADAFNITSSHGNRGFLGWSGSVLTGNSYKFGNEFWPLVGTMTLRNAALAAADEVPNNDDGTPSTPIRYYGDWSYNGEAWS